MKEDNTTPIHGEQDDCKSTVEAVPSASEHQFKNHWQIMTWAFYTNHLCVEFMFYSSFKIFNLFILRFFY